MDKVFDLRRKPKPSGLTFTKSIQPSQKPPADNHWPIILYYILAGVGGLMIAIGLTYFLTRAVSQKTPIGQAVVTAPSIPSPSITPSSATDSPRPSPSVNPFAELTPTGSLPSPTPVIDKSQVKIRVLNGNGLAGQAAKMRSTLVEAGFTVTAIGNAKRQDYPKTQVWYLASKKSQAEAVAAALSNRSIEVEEADQSTIGQGNDILVIVGQK